jgi:hypothetical protein
MGLNIDMPIPRDGGDFEEINGLLRAISAKPIPAFPSDESLSFDEWPDPFADAETARSPMTAKWIGFAFVVAAGVSLLWLWFGGLAR